MLTVKKDINLVVMGHFESGKSTSIGHTIFDCGGMDKKTMEKLEKETQEMGKLRFKFAWVINKFYTDRELDITTDVDSFKIETPRSNVTFIDVPGHHDFLKNMITGTCKADCALIMVSAVPTEFEAGVHVSIKEHALLAHVLGINQMILAVNKMDLIDPPYSEGRFTEIKEAVSMYLKEVGYEPDGVPFIPVSGWNGDNLVNESNNMTWYKGWTVKKRLEDVETVMTGMTLIDAFDVLQPALLPKDKPLRITLQDVYHVAKIGTVAVGRIESGIIKPGLLVTFAPQGLTAEVKSVKMHRGNLTEAGPGDTVKLHIVNASVKDIKPEDLCSDSKNYPARQTADFTAEVIIMNHPTQIHEGYSPVVNCHTANIAYNFPKFLTKIDSLPCKEIDDNSKQLWYGDADMIRMIPCMPMCVGNLTNYSQHSCFSVRDIGP